MGKHLAYIGFLQKGAKKGRAAVFLSSELSEVQEWKSLDPTSKKKDGIDSSDSNATININTNKKNDDGITESPAYELLLNLMNQFQKSILSYQTLIKSGITFLPFLSAHYINNEMLNSAKENFDLIEEDDDYYIFGVDDVGFRGLHKQMVRISELTEAEAVFPGAVLLSLVATFDSILVDVIRVMIRSNPERFKSSSKSMQVSDILSMKSFDELLDKIVDDEVNSTMRGSHVSQIEYIERMFNIDFPRSHSRWGDFVEVFERRNLVAHGSLVANEIYIENCKKCKYPVESIKKGSSLKLSEKYLSRSADILIEFGIEIVCLLWEKNFSDTVEKAYSNLNNSAYELLIRKRATLASHLLEFALGNKKKANVSDRIYKMMSINLANAYKKLKKIDDSKRIIDRIDWSASAAEFQICIAALREDVDAVVSLMGACTSTVGEYGFREWPVFDWVRADQKFSAGFRATFGEDIRRITEESASKSVDLNDNSGEEQSTQEEAAIAGEDDGAERPLPDDRARDSTVG